MNNSAVPAVQASKVLILSTLSMLLAPGFEIRGEVLGSVRPEFYSVDSLTPCINILTILFI